MDDEIKLSGTEFKALASETRTGIIKLLRDRNHTLTEISRKLQLAAPTIKQHLGILEKAELIQELDEGRKWKYYCLTRKGKNIFSHEAPINVFIVLGVTVVALVGLLYSFLSMVETRAMSFAGERSGEAFITVGKEAVSAPQAAASTAQNAASQAAASTAQNAASQAAASTAQNAAPVLAEAGPSGTMIITPEMTVLLFGIVAFSILAGFLIAKARR